MGTSSRVNEEQVSALLLHGNRGLKLWVILYQVSTLVKKARALELKQFDFTVAEAEVLYILNHENRGLTIAEIADVSGRELNSISIRVNKILKKGLVEKSRSSDDKKVEVFLTEKGRELYNDVTTQSVGMIFATLSEEEKGQLESILKKLRVRTRELLGMGYKPPFLP